jgi:hypothetical protein
MTFGRLSISRASDVRFFRKWPAPCGCLILDFLWLEWEWMGRECREAEKEN